VKVDRKLGMDLSDSRNARRTYERAAAEGARIWQEIQVPGPHPGRFIPLSHSQDIVRSLLFDHGSIGGIVRAMQAAGSTKSASALRRTVERNLQGTRRIGPEYRGLYQQIARPRTLASRQLALTQPPRRGTLTLQWVDGNVVISEDDRVRDLVVVASDAHGAWPAMLEDPMGYYQDNWDGPTFEGDGNLQITFTSPDAGPEEVAARVIDLRD
jgi:hypothetical protein